MLSWCGQWSSVPMFYAVAFDIVHIFEKLIACTLHTDGCAVRQRFGCACGFTYTRYGNICTRSVSGMASHVESLPLQLFHLCGAKHIRFRRCTFLTYGQCKISHIYMYIYIIKLYCSSILWAYNLVYFHSNYIRMKENGLVIFDLFRFFNCDR